MDFAVCRMKMVENQILTNRVTDPLVISAMSELPREAFVPEELKGVAYVDEAISLGNGRYLMEPMILARLLEAAQVQPTDVVLEIGCGAGYAAAVLARLASTVVALESDKELAARATATLGELGIDNVAVVEGKLEKGYSKQAPYDVIFINGAIGDVPSGMAKQLAEDGRLVAVFYDGALGRGKIVTRHAGTVLHREIFDAGTPVLSGFASEPAFAF